MPTARFSRSLKLPPVAVREALSGILQSISQGEHAWRGFQFHIELGKAHLPDVGFIAIPIRLQLAPEQPGIDQRKISIEAARHPSSFPTFEGALGVDAVGSASDESILWFIGDYHLPLGALGALVDATLATGIAERCLENFLEDLANACRARVEKAEAGYIRYRHFGS